MFSRMTSSWISVQSDAQVVVPRCEEFRTVAPDRSFEVWRRNAYLVRGSAHRGIHEDVERAA